METLPNPLLICSSVQYVPYFYFLFSMVKTVVHLSVRINTFVSAVLPLHGYL